MTNPMTCDRFADLLGPYLEGELPSNETAAVDAHARSCAECGALLADLQRLTVDARELPALTPSQDLWSGIETRIAAPVVPIDAGSSRRVTGSRPARRWAWPAAAAALMLLTAGVTYVTTRAAVERQLAQGAPQGEMPRVATVDTVERDLAADAASDIPVDAPVDAPTDSPVMASRSTSTDVDDAASIDTPRGSTAPASVGDRRRAPRLVGRPQLVTVAHRGGAPRGVSAAGTPLDAEISKLRTLLQERRPLLDTATIAVLERNLTIIDAAIADSRAALVRDPASGFLSDQLNDALGRKVRLLRTAALLPLRS